MTDSRVLVIVPTRGRPENIARLEAGLAETSTSVADFLYVIDEDDPTADGYRMMDLKRLLVIPRRKLGGTLNHVARQYTDRYEHIGFMGDDHLPRTGGWDRTVLGALDQKGPRIVYGDDLLQGAALPTAAFMNSRIIRSLGYMVPPEMVHLYLDNFWKELGERLEGLVYLPEVVIEHLHPAAGKAQWDPGYTEVNSPAMDTSDRDAWMRYRMNGELDEAVTRVNREYEL